MVTLNRVGILIVEVNKVGILRVSLSRVGVLLMVLVVIVQIGLKKASDSRVYGYRLGIRMESRLVLGPQIQ